MDYLKLYQDHRQELLARRGTLATDYPDSVATTWSLSFQKVQQENPAAAELLRLCAFLAPDIPEELIRDGAAYWPPLLQQAADDPLRFSRHCRTSQVFSGEATCGRPNPKYPSSRPGCAERSDETRDATPMGRKSCTSSQECFLMILTI